MKRMTLSEYLAVPENYRGVWTTERGDIPDWENLRKNHMGKRTLMVYDRGTCLLVEGLSLEIVDDSAWKKPEEIKKEIREKYQEYLLKKTIGISKEPSAVKKVIQAREKVVLPQQIDRIQFGLLTPSGQKEEEPDFRV